MKNQQSHILFLPRWYPSSADPMFGLFIKRHAEAVALRHHVSVVYALPTEKHQPVMVNFEQVEGVDTYYCLYRKSSCSLGAMTAVLNNIRYFRALWGGVKAANKRGGTFGFTHVHILTRLSVIALWLKFRHRIPFMVTEHWSRYLPLTNSFQGTFRKWLTRLAVRNASCITTVSQNLADAMKSHRLEHRDYRVLPNVVDITLFKPQKKSPGSIHRLVHVSCFEDRSKNISGLLRVLAKLSNERKDFQCTLVGDGIDFQAMKAYARELGLTGDQLVFTGLLERQALVDVIAEADFMVMFSNYENMPVVIPEAFACGIPVVATRVGGIPEIINEENGLLVDAADEAGLLKALLEMMENSRNYDPQSLRDTVVNKNSLQNVSAFLDDCYRSKMR
ncbi:MAG: glycosyltransferase [Bacteroidetes bacterium]|nr:glycosyltransferase [Bacteroidota bacterium]